MSEPSEKPNLFFRLTTFAGAVFVVTILSLVAATFGDPQAPPARFLHAHGTTLVVWEVAVILSSGSLAMAVDRRQILRQTRQEAAAARSRLTLSDGSERPDERGDPA
jgi:hypothetical protein